MILEKNNLQTVQEWTKSYIKLIALYVRAKKKQESSSITLKSHKLALDGSRLGLENKFLENKWSRIFLRSLQNLPNNLGACKPTFYIFYTLPEVKQYYEPLFLSYRPWTEYNISQFWNTNCTHSIFRTIEVRVGF